jgi:GNAT superfamily N-acetyltransferase
VDIVEINGVDEAARRDFAAVAHQVYADDPLWAPQSETFAASVISNPGHGQIRSLLCMDGTRAVARATAILRPGARDDLGRPLGYIGLFECLQDYEQAGRLLLSHAEQLLRQMGAASVQAPRVDNNLMGLIVGEVRRPQTILTAHNPPYYAEIFKGQDYRVREHLVTYIFDRSSARLFPLRLPGIRTRTFDRLKLEAETALFHDLNQQIFQGHPGWLPRSMAEDRAMIEGFLPMLDDDLVIIAEDGNGQPVGLLICLPDVYQASRGEPIDNARLMSIGAIPAKSQKGIGVAMCLHLVRNLLDKGYQTLEASWIRSTNMAPRNLAKRFVGRGGREFAVFEKDISAAAPGGDTG